VGEWAQNEVTEELGFGLIRGFQNNQTNPTLSRETPINQSKESMRAGLILWGNQRAGFENRITKV
jgi:hypothetical protein